MPRLCPWAAPPLEGAGGGGPVAAPKTRLPLIGQGGSGRKVDQGNASSWTRRTGLGPQAPPNTEEAVARAGFPSQNLWHRGGHGGWQGADPKFAQVVPTALLEGDDRAEILMAWELSATPIRYHFTTCKVGI